MALVIAFSMVSCPPADDGGGGDGEIIYIMAVADEIDGCMVMIMSSTGAAVTDAQVTMATAANGTVTFPHFMSGGYTDPTFIVSGEDVVTLTVTRGDVDISVDVTIPVEPPTITAPFGTPYWDPTAPHDVTWDVLSPAPDMIDITIGSGYSESEAGTATSHTVGADLLPVAGSLTVTVMPVNYTLITGTGVQSGSVFLGETYSTETISTSVAK